MQKQILKLITSKKRFSLKSDGLSMMYFLRPNDVITYEKISFQKVKVNDIILVRKGSTLLTHRVIYKTEKYLITKGDNNFEADGKIYPQQIVAKVIEVKRGGNEFNPESQYFYQSVSYLKEIITLKKIFHKKQINFVFLKGLPLHLYYEKKHPRRFYLDCDVLIDKKDLQKAEKILLVHGYKKSEDRLSESLEKIRNKTTEKNYYKKVNGFFVVFDLHLEVVFMMTQLGRLNQLYPQELLDSMTMNFLIKKKNIRINNELFPILSPPHLIVYLALHFFHHNFTGAFRLEFLHNVIIRSTLSLTDWKDIDIIIKQYKVENFVYPAFYLLHKYYKTPIASLFSKRIKKQMTDRSNIFNDEGRIQGGVRRFTNLFFLSPYPFHKRVLIFFNLGVLYTLFWLAQKKVAGLIPKVK